MIVQIESLREFLSAEENLTGLDWRSFITTAGELKQILLPTRQKLSKGCLINIRALTKEEIISLTSQEFKQRVDTILNRPRMRTELATGRFVMEENNNDILG